MISVVPSNPKNSAKYKKKGDRFRHPSKLLYTFLVRFPFAGLFPKRATHLRQDIFKTLYVKSQNLSPEFKTAKTLDFKGCPALSG